MKIQAISLGVALLAIAGSAAAQNRKNTATTPKCDGACLTTAMEDFLAKTVGHRASEIKIAPDALIYFNTTPGKLEDNPLARAKAIRSKQIFADGESANVVARTGVEMEDGKIAYASTRLKIAGGTITQVETSFDGSQRVVASYVTFLDPVMTTIVPEKERMSRAELKALIERYFQGLSDHQPVAADYDDRCDRYHSGQRITNNARNTVEASAGGSCYQSNVGNKPWGPATDIHIPLIDPEHGIVVGYTLLLYQNNSAPMYVSEMFKVLNGKVRQIDNIGLKAEGLKPVKFPE